MGAGARPRTLPAALAPVLVGTSIAYSYLAPLLAPRRPSRVAATAAWFGVRPAHRLDAGPGRELRHARRRPRALTLVGSSRSARCSRWSSRSRCRWASTTRTTTATASAAPTTRASARCASSARGSRRRASVKLRGVRDVRRRRARRPRARAAHPGVVAARSSARPRSSRRGSTPAARAPTGTPVSASCSCSCSSASSPSRARRTCRPSRISWLALAGGVACGALSVAILLANNLRDIPTDTVAGKRTLAVRLGDARTRAAYPSRRHASSSPAASRSADVAVGAARTARAAARGARRASCAAARSAATSSPCSRAPASCCSRTPCCPRHRPVSRTPHVRRCQRTSRFSGTSESAGQARSVGSGRRGRRRRGCRASRASPPGIAGGAGGAGGVRSGHGSTGGVEVVVGRCSARADSRRW